MKTMFSKAKWTLLLIATWLILTAADLGSWVIGLPFIALAILLQPDSETRFFKSSPFINIIGLVQFGYYFYLSHCEVHWMSVAEYWPLIPGLILFFLIIPCGCRYQTRSCFSSAVSVYYPVHCAQT